MVIIFNVLIPQLFFSFSEKMTNAPYTHKSQGLGLCVMLIPQCKQIL